ncbi:hypothetical protein FQA39_LY15194 [Lamprigera yunnana]|nr:hypothetical protein FQA39_LY15194 [Lamprigera yunnana]
MRFWNFVVGKRKNWFNWNCVVIGDDILRVAKWKKNGETATYWNFEENKFFVGLETLVSEKKFVLGPEQVAKCVMRVIVKGENRSVWVIDSNEVEYETESLIKDITRVKEATVHVVTTLGAGNVEYFLLRAIGKVNCNYGSTAPNVSGLHKR